MNEIMLMLGKWGDNWYQYDTYTSPNAQTIWFVPHDADVEMEAVTDKLGATYEQPEATVVAGYAKPIGPEWYPYLNRTGYISYKWYRRYPWTGEYVIRRNIDEVDDTDGWWDRIELRSYDRDKVSVASRKRIARLVEAAYAAGEREIDDPDPDIGYQLVEFTKVQGGTDA